MVLPGVESDFKMSWFRLVRCHLCAYLCCAWALVWRQWQRLAAWIPKTLKKRNINILMWQIDWLLSYSNTRCCQKCVRPSFKITSVTKVTTPKKYYWQRNRMWPKLHSRMLQIYQICDEDIIREKWTLFFNKKPKHGDPRGPGHDETRKNARKC